MNGISKLAQLKALFTPTNVRYLDRILSLLLSGKGPLFQLFWTEFKRSFPQDADRHYSRAWGALCSLHAMVKEEL